MSYVASAAVELQWSCIPWLVEPSAIPQSQTSSTLIYSCIKGPVRRATLGKHICRDVYHSTGKVLLTHMRAKAITHAQAEYQRI